MNTSLKNLASASAATLIAGTAATTAQAADKEWNFEIMPYLWAAGIDGDLNIGSQDTAINPSFSDLFDMMEIGGGLLMRAERSRWVLARAARSIPTTPTKAATTTAAW